MNIWEHAVMTNKGIALLAKMTAGHSVSITKAQTGTGLVEADQLQSLTAVAGAKQDLGFSRIAYPETGKCALTCILNNGEVATGYTATQVGIFAEDPEEGEVLFFIAQAAAGTGTIVPSATEMPGYNAEWTFYFKYGQADNVTVEVGQYGAVTIDMLNAKADADLANVSVETFTEKVMESGAGLPVVTTTGDGAAYVATIPGVTELKAGLAFIMIPHTVSTTNKPTLNVNGLGAKNLRQPLSLNTGATTTAAIDSWLSEGKPTKVLYDGTLWKIEAPRPSATAIYGTVAIENGGTGADTAEEALKNLGAAAADHKHTGYAASNHNHDGVYAPAYTYETTDLVDGTSPLSTGTLYFYYEEA